MAQCQCTQEGNVESASVVSHLLLSQHNRRPHTKRLCRDPVPQKQRNKGNVFYTGPKADTSSWAPGTHAEVRMKRPVLQNARPGLKTVDSAELTDPGNEPKLSML